MRSTELVEGDLVEFEGGEDLVGSSDHGLK